ncbi:MAG: ABC transporter substrate-binding protein [Gorillibacterium sp.]|nr:ABC transporter substrate-binding protein [Gorillibacterium sp.]
MKKMLGSTGLVLLLILTLSACGSSNDKTASTVAPTESAAVVESSIAPTNSTSPDQATNSAETKTIKYLDQEYTVPATAERIVITGSMEAMEDALVLDVHPVGAITFAGKFPERFATITAEAQSIGEKSEPNFETILSLKPDVILGTTKFKPEVVEQLQKIGTLIQVSHIATNWEANLNLLAELTGKQDKAKQEIEQYQTELVASRAQLTEKLKDKKVVAIRVRNGELYVYPQTVFVNPILYADLGLTVPAEIQAAKAQEVISIEKFAEMNADYLFIQFSDSENADAPNSLKDIENNPIIQMTNAFKDGHAFVNVIDPLSEGGPAWSRINFLKAVVENVSK